MGLSQRVEAAGLIRDAEIEHTLRSYADPVYQAAGLTPSSIHMYIVQDDTINAFVMGGSNVFVHTGLIMQCATPDMLIGVLAHETGHIADGHLIRSGKEMGKAQMTSIMGYLLGAVAMVGGQADLGAAVMSANQNIALRNLLSYTRANEQAADQSALQSLDKVGVSASGMLKVFEILRKQENRAVGVVDPYMQTHPLSKDRIEHIAYHVQHSKVPLGAYPKKYDPMHQRMLGKLEGFLKEPADILAKYAATDTSDRALYARAVAYYRMSQLQNALAELDKLLAKLPKDPYYHEMKGQVLFESGKIAEAQQSYRKAVGYLPNSPLIRTEFARTLLASDTPTPEQMQEALQALTLSSGLEHDNAETWRLLATAHGRLNQLDLSHLALAEEAMLQDKPEQALQQLELAKPYIRAGSPAELRSQDLKRAADEARLDKKKRDGRG